MELNKFYNQDILEGLKNIKSESIDIIIADPPYNFKKSFQNDNLPLDKYISWGKLWMNECVRVLKSGGSLYIYGFPEILAYLSTNLPLKKRWLQWTYKNKATPKSSFWIRSHESIIHAYKDTPRFNVDDVRIPYTKEYLKQVGKTRTQSDTARFGDSGETKYRAHEKGALPRDVIEIPALAGSSGSKERWFLLDGKFNLPQNIKNLSKKEKKKILKHETQKPLKLTEILLKAVRPEKDGLVLIPFGGSGSEGVICKKLNLNFIGFEIDKDFCYMSNEAIKNYHKLI